MGNPLPLIAPSLRTPRVVEPSADDLGAGHPITRAFPRTQPVRSQWPEPFDSTALIMGLVIEDIRRKGTPGIPA
jgi:hypothetical protein